MLELYEGTLNVAVYYSFLGHILRAASWPQRYAAGVRVPGAELLDEDGDGRNRRGIITDPATLLILEIDPDNPGGANIGQWAMSADAEMFMGVLAKYERRLASFAGINAADQVRMDGDPRSGYAVSVSREAQREVQRRYEPQFRAGDLELLGKSAAIKNRLAGGAYPESGYVQSYQGIPLSLEERRMQREELLALLEAGLLDRVSAYQELHPGMSRARAEQDLAAIDAINGGSGAESSPREIAEMLQKIYLAVGPVISQAEARSIVERAGVDLPGGADLPTATTET